MDVVMAGNQQGGAPGNNVLRDYRKGNWTVQETMVLIEAKKMDDERRMRRQVESSSSSSISERGGKPTELRWKWVEDYCWKKGCFRSQNQCNDKWDNLMRDFKKVREYERRIMAADQKGGGDSNNNNGCKSYWKLEKNERKERNLPSNMLVQIYEALVDVVDRKGHQQQRLQVAVVSGCGSGSNDPSISNMPPPPPPPLVAERSTKGHHLLGGAPRSSILPPPIQHPPLPVAAALPLPAPSPHIPPSTSAHHPLPSVDHICDSSDPDEDTSDHQYYSDSPAKRRRRDHPDEGTSTGGATATPQSAGNTTNNINTTATPQQQQQQQLNINEVGTAISRSASIIAETIQACEEREERRHRELVSLQERRLQIEESKAEINRQGINGLVDAVNRLANSILALATHRNQGPST